MKQWLAVLTVLVCATASRAQVGVYAMGSAGRVSGIPATGIGPGGPVVVGDKSFWAFGGTFGVYDDFRRFGPLKLGGDARGFIQNHSSSSMNLNGNKLSGGLTGLRLSLHVPALPFKPYIQAEIGAASTNYGQNSFRTTNFAYQVQLGADFTVFPHLDLRAEYGGGEILSSSKSNPMQQLGGGAVIRF